MKTWKKPEILKININTGPDLSNGENINKRPTPAS